MVRATALVIVMLAAAPAAADQPTGKMTKEEWAASTMTAEQAAARVKFNGFGDLDPVLWISTEPFLEYRNQGDKFWRAMVDKETGKVTYQVYLKSRSTNPLRLSKLTYAINGKLRSVPLERISFDVNCHRYGCTHYEDFIGEFPKEDLESLSVGADSNDIAVKMKVFGDTVSGIDTEFFRNEIAGLLIVAAQRRRQFYGEPVDQAPSQ